MKYNSSFITDTLISDTITSNHFSTNNIGFSNPLIKGVIRVYQNDIPWQCRTHITLLSLGKTLGLDYFIHPFSDLLHPIPNDTKIILLAANSSGNPQATLQVNLPIAQYHLKKFVIYGGILIADLATNQTTEGYIIPGATGAVTRRFPDVKEAHKLYLTKEALSSYFVHGPTLTLYPYTISMDPSTTYAVHGNLVDSILLPTHAIPLMTAAFDSIQKTVLAYYALGGGYVLLDTITKEFYGQAPSGFGPAFLITNLIYFAYSLSQQ
ncbi:MAG: hypothetical protein ACRCW2_06285 [Cellulosilyticaceae bacterium]